MICPKCGEEVLQELDTCPNCGAAMTAQEPDTENQPVPAEAPAEVEENAQPAEEAGETLDMAAETEKTATETLEPAETEETAESDESEEAAELPEEAPKKKKKSPGAVIAGVVIVLLAVIVVCLAVALNYVSKNGKLPSLTEIMEQAKEKKIDGDAAAVKVQNADGETVEEITNQQLSYYFWGEYFYYVNNYGFSFDASLPLDQQTYQEATDSEKYGENKVYSDFEYKEISEGVYGYPIDGKITAKEAEEKERTDKGEYAAWWVSTAAASQR